MCLVDSTSDLFDAHFKFTVKDLKFDAIAQDLRTGQEFNDNIGYGWSKFVKHSELPKEAGLQHGLEAIIVCCEVNYCQHLHEGFFHVAFVDETISYQ